MRTNGKKALSLVLAVVMCLALCPLSAFAAEGDLTIENGVLKKYNGTGGDVVIPDGVTNIGDSAFLGCTGLTSVTIPDSVTSIGFQAFLNCTGLTSVIIGNGVTQIGDSAFTKCDGLISVDIPNSVTSIGSYAFDFCSGLTNVSIPNSVTKIGDGAFLGCISLTSVNIPNSITTIGDRPFSSCTNLLGIQVDAENQAYTSVDGVLFSKDLKTLVQYPGGKKGAYTVPNSVTSVGLEAFWGCQDLTSVTIPNSVTTIQSKAFGNCLKLVGIQVDTENQAYTSVDGVLFSKDLKTLIQCPAVKKGAYTIPNSVTSIGTWAFGNAGLTSVTIPDSVTSIEDHAFSYCRLTTVTIPNNVTQIGEYAFNGCMNLTSVTIGNSVTRIRRSTFYHCSSLTKIAIPDSITTIESAFFSCTKLKDIYYSGTQEQWATISIERGMVGSSSGPVDGNLALHTATIHFNSTMPDQPATPVTLGKAVATPTNDALSVDDASMTPAAYKIDGANYFKLRDVAMMMNGTAGQFSVDYDGELRAVKIAAGQPYTPQGGELKNTPTANATAEISNNEIYINGEKAELTVYKIGGENYFGIRELAQKLGFNVGWTGERGMFIESDKPYDPNN